MIEKNVIILMDSNMNQEKDGAKTKKEIENGNSTALEGYDHIFRRKTQCELLRLSCTVMGIEIAYSALTGFVSPILLQSGIRHEQTSLIWAISPVLGLLLSPLIGSVSDRCRLHFGRRRPFIIILAILEVIGLALICNSKYLGNLIGNLLYPEDVALFSSNKTVDEYKTSLEPFGSVDVNNKIHIWIVSITIFGIVIADFSTDALQNPSRAYLIDVCHSDDHARGLSSCAILAGCGGFFGYLLGAINWNNNAVGRFMGGHVRSLYTFTISIFMVCVLTAVTSFKEIPLTVLATKTDNKPKTNEKPQFTDYLKSIITMPYSLKTLYLTNLLCWISHINFCLYFTDFVGEVIFQGSPEADVGSEGQQLYESGVRFACIGMCLYSLSCVCFSAIIEKCIKLFGLQYVYIVIIAADSTSLFCMALLKNKILILLLCMISGAMYCTIVTVPYMLVAYYHTKNVFDEDEKRNPVPHKQIRGLGTDISVIGTSMCVAQCLLSLLIGPTVSLVGSGSVILTISSFFGFFAAIVATQVMYLEL